jgi:hypothetical protein
METVIEVVTDRIKYMVMSQDQNASRSHHIKIDNWSCEMVDECRYLETTLTNQNSIQQEFKRRLKNGNVCYHLVHTICLPSCYSKIES